MALIKILIILAVSIASIVLISPETFTGFGSDLTESAKQKVKESIDSIKEDMLNETFEEPEQEIILNKSFKIIDFGALPCTNDQVCNAYYNACEFECFCDSDGICKRKVEI